MDSKFYQALSQEAREHLVEKLNNRPHLQRHPRVMDTVTLAFVPLHAVQWLGWQWDCKECNEIKKLLIQHGYSLVNYSS